ncbi:hypothetical protein EVG20_g6463 [Dentipellis fragilis]|uniref:Uncharacterized protein n=1 Tax=Dentipellis fragilis TaxID=205917 RepID=A0A4Y9YMC2_9AGAM|nr:hypothetical protein EVG20_g6463 [Dentipellis fragilis]
MSTSNNLAPPPGGAPMLYQQQRRMTSPSLPPPPSPLNLPEPVYGNSGQAARRPPSPLRNAFTLDPEGSQQSEDGSDVEDDEDQERTWERTHSPSSSVTKFATSFAQRVGSFVNTMNGQSPQTLPSDAELEAEAERERDRGRREAEMILTREAEERRMMEERVLAMLQTPPKEAPNRNKSVDAPSPATSQKESPSWWAAAKHRLTPTKEPLTPAQQIIQETKEREKKEKKDKKAAKRERSTSREPQGEWPASPEKKFSDPAFLSLAIPPAPPPRRPVPTSPSSPTPGVSNRQNSLPPSLAPSPLRSNDGHASSPSREAPPLYAQFNGQGTLDVPGTLLVIAKRFEKLEKWTVGHVRALEERMSDVERWLVEKEKEKEDMLSQKEEDDHDEPDENAINEMRNEIMELQGRIGELGREMAKLATAPANLSSGPSRSPAPVSSAPQTNSVIAVHSLPPVAPVASPPHRTPSVTSPQRRNSMSPSFVPPMAASSVHTPRSRLPYPTGDYATPPDSVVLSQGVFSPTNSPPSSITSNTRARPMSIAGLPSLGANPAANASSSSLSGLPSSISPQARSISPSTLPAPQASTKAGSTSPASLTAPKEPSPRPSSISPTPRKRYTVALGNPIMRGTRPPSEDFSTYNSPGPISAGLPDEEEEEDEEDDYDETIGKAASARMPIKNGVSAVSEASPSPSPSPRPPRSIPRSRAQTSYGPSAPPPPASAIERPSSTAPLRPKVRSKSIDVGLGISMGFSGDLPPITPTNGKFVDPLLVRKQEKQALMSAAPPTPKTAVGKRKVPVGELVAFFDK